MPRETLTIDTIGNVDSGALRIAVNQALKLATQDLTDRPALDKKRVVALIVELKPVMDLHSSQPSLDSADVTWQVKTVTPAIGSAGLVMKPQADGQLYFHSDLPQDPDDDTIMDEAERRRRERGGERP